MMKLSVFVVTYNQEEYIRQCLDSILMQKTDFDYEIVIGEDHGIDGTRAICEEYALKYPRIKLLPVIENLGISGNWRRVLSECIGEYIAMCEGDDYWVDDLKLQKQVNLMEKDKSIGYVFTKQDRLMADGSFTAVSRRFASLSSKMSLHELIACHLLPPPTQTVCFRRSLLPKHIPNFGRSAELQQDMVLLFLIAPHCNIGYIDEITAVYRLGGITSYSNIPHAIQTKHDLFRKLNIYTNYEYDYYLNNKNDDWEYLTYYYLNTYNYLSTKQRFKATYYFIKKIIYSCFHYPKINMKNTWMFIKHYIKNVF